MALIYGIAAGVFIVLVVGVPATAWAIKRQVRRARAAERRARTAERMAEIGTMTGGLAHEIKNPLSTLGLNAQLLGEALEDLEIPEPEKGRLIRRTQTMRQEADRLRDTLADFLRFAGEMRLERRPLDLNTVVEELSDFYSPQADAQRIAMHTQCADGELRVEGDVGLLKQAVLNLMINASQAIAESRTEDPGTARAGSLTLRTSRGSGEEGRECHLHVIDTGPGIPQEQLERIFTPYFSTTSGGTGLGLPTTKRIIEEHGGQLEVVTHPGEGCDFLIRLPAQ